MLDTAHEGYEYQDYLTVAFALREVLLKSRIKMIIDRKTVANDKFDDLKLLRGDFIDCYQIKYSDSEHSHKLTQYDLSNGNSHDTSLSGLFKSWKNLSAEYRNVRLTLCVAWDVPTADDAIWEVITECTDSGFIVPSKRFLINVNALWPEGGEPLKNWVKFRKEMKAVIREEFVQFCENFSIETELPKASLDLSCPGNLEVILQNLSKKLGIGIFPNQSLNSEDIIFRLASIVKSARALGKSINTGNLPQQIGLITDYGMLNQEFHVDDMLYVSDTTQFKKISDKLDEAKRVVFIGNPGSGKSWFVEKFVEYLRKSAKHVIRFNCYVALNDVNAKERIKTNVLYGNFIGQLLKEYPFLSDKKHSLYGADREELQNLLQYVTDDCYIIIDGLDHIRRQYDLYKADITLNETEILEELSMISFPKSIHVMLSSQPLDQFQRFYDKGYTKVEIENWSIDKTKHLMNKYNIRESSYEEGEGLSAFLNLKSQGNALYLNYLLRQLQGIEITKKILDAIPNYDPSLKEYYEYLFTQVSNKRIVFALCGVDFYLSSEELKDITGYGDIVDSELKIIYPLLNENIVSGGILLYHESFRRYIIESLKHKNINVSKTIYRDVIDWLLSKDFYGFRKSYCHLIKYLYQTEQYIEAVKLLQPNFIHMSIKYGFSYDLIRQNIWILEVCSSRIKSLPFIAMANELDNILETTSVDVLNSEDYFQALCDLKGPEQLNAMLEYNGKATFPQETGLKICYICSKYGIMPWWKLYNDNEKTEYTSDEYPYYFRGIVDKYGIEVIPKILIDIEAMGYQMRKNFQVSIYYDVKNYLGIDEFCRIVKKNKLKYWQTQINEHEIMFYAKNKLDDSEVLNQANKILELKVITEEDVFLIKSLFSQLRIRLENNDEAIYQQLVLKFAKINWFYNWIIFTLKIIRIQAKKIKKNYELDGHIKNIEREVILSMEILLRDTEVFKGEPRTCDLHGVRHLIRKTFCLALDLIQTQDSLNKALDILEKVSQETTTSLDNTNGGPLPDYSLVAMLASKINSENQTTILPYIISAKKASEDTEVYGTTASINFQIASIIAKIDKDEAEKYYDEGVHYLLAYGYHKDISIEQVLDSYSAFAILNPVGAESVRLEITSMTIALLNHTDGRITNHYLNSWFRILLETDIQYALSFLQGYQLIVKDGWILEEMILDSAKRLSYDEKYNEFTIKLLESLPNTVTNDLIEISIRMMDRMLVNDKAATRRFYINIISRFNYEKTSHAHYERYLSTEYTEKLIAIGKELGESVSHYESYFSTISKEENKITDEIEKYIEFNCVTVAEAYKWFESNFLSEANYDSIIDFIHNKLKNKEELVGLFCSMIDKDRFGENERDQINHIKYLVEHVKISNHQKAEIYCMIFCKSKSWGHGLNDTESFIKAYMYEQSTAMKTLFEELPNTIQNRGTVVTKGIVKALYKVGGNEKIIIDIWNYIYPIMKLRFPNLEICDELGDDDADVSESLISITLGRILGGEKERMQVAYSYLEDCFHYGKDYEMTIALRFFFKYFKDFNYLSQYAILGFIQKNAYDFSDECFNTIMEAVLEIYPTNDFLLDTLILESGLQIYLAEKSDYSFLNIDLNECRYPRYLHEIEESSKYEDIGINLYAFDKHIRLLLDNELDGELIYKKIRASKIVRQSMKRFISPMHRLTVDNTIFKSYVMQYTILALVEHSINNDEFFFIDRELLRFTVDFSELDMYRKTRCISPEEHLYDKLGEDSKKIFVYSENICDYQRIACLETLIKSDGHRNISIVEGTQSICLENSNNSLKKELLLQFTGTEGRVIEDEEGALCYVGSKYDNSFESEEYLWVTNEIMTEFNLALIYDEDVSEFIGIDMTNNERVLRLRNWRCNYIGDSEYKGYEIPLYNGVELLMKTSYIRKLEEHYGNLYMSTNVKKIVDIEDGLDAL